MNINTVYKVEGLEFETLCDAKNHIRKVKLFDLLESSNIPNLLDVVDILVDKQFDVVRILRD